MALALLLVWNLILKVWLVFPAHGVFKVRLNGLGITTGGPPKSALPPATSNSVFRFPVVSSTFIKTIGHSGLDAIYGNLKVLVFVSVSK